MTASPAPQTTAASAGPSSSRFARAVSSLLSPFSSSLASTPNSSSRRSSSNSSLSPERSRSVSDAGPKGGPSAGAGGGGRELGVEDIAHPVAVGRKGSPWAAWASMVSLNLEPYDDKHPPASTPPRDHTTRLGTDVSLTTTRETGRSLAASASARNLALEPDTSTGSSRVSTFTRLIRRRSTNLGAARVNGRARGNSKAPAPPAAPPRIALEDFGFVRDGPPTPPMAPADLPRIELHLVDTALDLDLGEELPTGAGH